MVTLALSRDELNKIKYLVEDPAFKSLNIHEKQVSKQAELKRLSDNRVRHWPNTAQALKKKKESFLADRAYAMEQNNLRLDAEVF